MRLLITTQAVDADDPVLGFFCAWIAAFAAQCESVEVICLREGTHALPANVRVHSLGKDRGAARLLRWWRALRLIISLRRRYDAVFVHMNPEYVLLGGLFWRLTGAPVVLWYTHKHVDLKLRLATVLATRIATASKESFRLPTSKLVVIGHGIDTEFFNPRGRMAREEGTLRVLSAGRLSPTKRHDLVLRAAARLQNAQLAIVGAAATAADAEYEKKLHALARELGIEARVVFAGPRRHEAMRDAYWGADVFAHASETGSVDKVVLEALACGTPVVSTSEAFSDGSLPVIHAPADPKTFSQALEKAGRGSHPERLAEAVVSSHSLTPCIKRIVKLYA